MSSVLQVDNDRATREVDEALNSRLHLPRGAPGFMTARGHWRQQQRRAHALEWRSIDDGLVAEFDGGRFIIRRTPDGDHVLLYRWARGGSRVLGRGAASELSESARASIALGGPFGEPIVDEPFAEPRLTWADSDLPDEARVQTYGWGFGFRHRPIDGQRYLVLVSPLGSFALGGAGQFDDVGGRTLGMRSRLSPYATDLGPEHDPFFVRVDGAPVRLAYTACPSFLGYTRLTEGKRRGTEVFLVLVGTDDQALVRVVDEECTMVARGPGRALVGAEVFPGDQVTTAPQEVVAPSSLAPDAVATAIGDLRCMAACMREHLATLARSATGRTGMRSARELVWLVAVAHERGYRERICGPLRTVLKILSAAAGIEVAPCDRALRPALTWLHQHSPIFLLGSPPRWGVRIDLLSKPDLAAVEWLRRRR